MVRTRSNRGNASHAHTSQPTSNLIAQPTSTATSSARPSQSCTPELGSGKKNSSGSHHRKNGSGAHILKQIASFNRSPDMDRHRSIPGELASDISSSDELQNHVREGVIRRDDSASGSQSGGRPHVVRSSSRRSAQGGLNAAVVAATSVPASLGTPTTRVSRSSRQRATETEPRSARASRSLQHTPEAQQPVEDTNEPGPPEEAEEEIHEPAQELDIDTAPVSRALDDEEEDEEEEDPNEPKYCYCGRGSFGEMIACDNEDCTMEWFHLECTGLRSVPGPHGESLALLDYRRGFAANFRASQMVL